MDSSISSVKIGTRGEEYAAMHILEVTSIPDVASVLSERQSADESDVIAAYRDGMAVMLSEAHQRWKAWGSGSRDVSVELMWLTRSVANQPYAASIRLFLVSRALAVDRAAAEDAVRSIARDCSTTLDLQRYEYRPLPHGEFATSLSELQTDAIRLLVREGRIRNLQNAILPWCFSFDVIRKSGQDLARIANELASHPGCAFSVQLMPVSYSPQEAAVVDSLSQNLETLQRGVMTQGVGSVGFTLAERPAEVYKYYSENKDRALFRYNIAVLAPERAAEQIMQRLFGQLNAGRDGAVAVKNVSIPVADVGFPWNDHPLPWAINQRLHDLTQPADAAVGQGGDLLRVCGQLPGIITAEEAAELFRLPIGSRTVAAGLTVNESGGRKKTYAENVVDGADIEVGQLKSSSGGNTIGFSVDDLTKHALIAGTPGSGKTTFAVGLLDRLWKRYNIPFLVIEPAKNEYRALVRSIPDLQVFTPGKDFISPFIFNPFLPPKNVRLGAYKSTLKTAFAAAVSMSSPLDKIFEEAVNNCYSEFRWLDSYTSANKGRVFNIADFIRCFRETFEAIGYVGEALNIGRAGTVRLGSLSNLFDHYHSIPIEDLLSRPTVIELAAIENNDQKALLIALLLLSILAYVNANYVGEGRLKNVILLEEAHVLLGGGTNAVQGEADPGAIAQELIKRMLAEIRAYGVGMVIADQSPRKVTADVVALTDIKVAFRIVEAGDRQIVSDSTNMDAAQTERLGRLRPGEAFLFFGRLDAPEEVRISDYRLKHEIGVTLSDEAIRERSTYWRTRQRDMRPYPECRFVRYCAEMCRPDLRELAREAAKRIFAKNFKGDTRDFEVLRSVFGSISQRVRAELNDEPFSAELLACTKCHLWRRIRYGTRIDVSEALIRNSLRK